jgi:hypothetical protein
MMGRDHRDNAQT